MINGREVLRNGSILRLSCVGENYHEVLKLITALSKVKIEYQNHVHFARDAVLKTLLERQYQLVNKHAAQYSPPTYVTLVEDYRPPGKCGPTHTLGFTWYNRMSIYRVPQNRLRR
jgi:hypothetical protein